MNHGLRYYPTAWVVPTCLSFAADERYETHDVMRGVRAILVLLGKYNSRLSSSHDRFQSIKRRYNDKVYKQRRFLRVGHSLCHFPGRLYPVCEISLAGWRG